MGSNRREPEILVGDDIFAGIDDLPKAEGHVVEHPPYVCDVCGAPEGRCIHFGGTNYKVIPEDEYQEPEKATTGPERKPCPECGKEVTWTKAGKPRAHKCEPKNVTVSTAVVWVCSVCGSTDYDNCGHKGVDVIKKEDFKGEALKPTDSTTNLVCSVCGKSDYNNCGHSDFADVIKKEDFKITLITVVAKFVETRDLIAEKQKALKAEISELNELQAKRSAWLQGRLDQMGVESFKTKAGTAFITYKDSATVADRGTFFSWVQEDWDNRECYLENRVSKTAVKQRLEDGEVAPPGVNYSKFKDVQIRRA